MLTLQAKQQFQKDGYIVAENIIQETLTKELGREVEILTTTEERDQFYQSFPNEVHLNVSSQTAIIQDPLL